MLSALNWVLYISAEPFVRRRWPHVLISWTRLLSGKLRDPLLGRDALISCAAGVVSFFVLQLQSVAATYSLDTNRANLFALAHPVGLLRIVNGVGAIDDAVAALFLVSVLRILMRSQWLPVTVLTIVLGALGAFTSSVPLIAAPFFLLFSALFLLVLARFGFLASILQWYVFIVLTNFPMTL